MCLCNIRVQRETYAHITEAALCICDYMHEFSSYDYWKDGHRLLPWLQVDVLLSMQRREYLIVCGNVYTRY
jgi:hypothetical protein